MIYNKLGETGLTVSRLGLGGIPLQRTTPGDTRRLFDALCDVGVNYVDTARGYTVSEEYIGDALSGRRDKFIIATKSMAKTKAEMASDIEKSLRNLKTDHIELYQIHNPSPDGLSTVIREGGALEALTEAKRAGKILHIGLTAHSHSVFERALELKWVETIMFPYSIVEDGAEGLIKECCSRGVGFIAMKPLSGGAIRNGSAALRFISANSDVSIVIPGMYTPDEVVTNAAAVCDKSAITEKESEEFERIKQELTGHFCRRCGYCAPCTVGIDIPSVFLFDGYMTRYGLEDWAHERYSSLAHRASECIGCGVCETRCPYELPIREMLRDASSRFDT